MRADMDKVLVERPRRRSAWPRKGRAPRDGAALPRLLGLRRGLKEHGGYIDLNENLQPLRRFLEGQVGRPWNKVYGEIRAGIDTGNEVQAHVLTHIENFLYQHVEKAPAHPVRAPCGVIALRRHWGRWPLRPDELYVDPDDGIIKRARRKIAAPDRTKAPVTRFRLGPMRMAVRDAGIWFAVELSPYRVVSERGADDREQEVFDVGGRRSTEWTDPLLGPVWAHDKAKLVAMAKAYGPGWLAANKRQLGGRELAQHGLRNEVDV